MQSHVNASRAHAHARDRNRSRQIVVRLRAREGARFESHSHYLIPAIDIDDLAGYCRGSIAGKKDSGGA